MNTRPNILAAAFAAATLAGTPAAFAQDQTEPAPQQQNPMMGAEGMSGMEGGDMQGMMQMMSQMSEMMENCNRMMKAKAATDEAAPDADEPQQDNG